MPEIDEGEPTRAEIDNSKGPVLLEFARAGVRTARHLLRS